jgi:hypothetical protein
MDRLYEWSVGQEQAAQYFTYGRLSTHQEARKAKQQKHEPANKRLTPFAVKVADGTPHCGVAVPWAI